MLHHLTPIFIFCFKCNIWKYHQTGSNLALLISKPLQLSHKNKDFHYFYSKQPPRLQCFFFFICNLIIWFVIFCCRNGCQVQRQKRFLFFRNEEGSKETAQTVRAGILVQKPEPVPCCIWPSLLVFQAPPGAPGTWLRSCWRLSMYHRCLSAETAKVLYCVSLAFIAGERKKITKK